MCQVNEKKQIVILGEDEEGIKLIVLMGKFDLSELVAQEMNDEEEAPNMSLSVKTHQWEDDEDSLEMASDEELMIQGRARIMLRTRRMNIPSSYSLAPLRWRM